MHTRRYFASPTSYGTHPCYATPGFQSMQLAQVQRLDYSSRIPSYVQRCRKSRGLLTPAGRPPLFGWSLSPRCQLNPLPRTAPQARRLPETLPGPISARASLPLPSMAFSCPKRPSNRRRQRANPSRRSLSARLTSTAKDRSMARSARRWWTGRLETLLQQWADTLAFQPTCMSLSCRARQRSEMSS